MRQMKGPRRRRALRWLGCSVALVAQILNSLPGVHAQHSSEAARVSDRMRALQRESEQLATQSRTLLGDLRQLEIARDVKAEETTLAEAAAARAEAALRQGAVRLAALEQQRQAQAPDIKARLVDLYKRGRGGYARLLAGAESVRDLARATRAVAALTTITERRIDQHRRTVAAVRAEQAALQARASELERARATAVAARAAAERAVRQRAALIDEIDRQRDLTAQLAGELQTAAQRLQEHSGGPVTEPGGVPLAPFRGALDWPAPGRVAAAFGQSSNRLGGSALRNGLEIAAAQDTIVRAVHGGTVAYAEPFTGFGNLVIVDHGGNDFSLYGYLGTIAVSRNQPVTAGAELGRVGTAPAGPPALYFEIRIDGRSVDPVEWLKPL